MTDAVIQKTGEIVTLSRDLSLPGRVTPVGLLLPSGLKFEEWQNVGQRLTGVEGSLMWWIGDWLRYGEKNYGETYAQAIDATDKSYETVRAAKWVAEKFESVRRRTDVPWSFHKEVAALPSEVADELLDLAKSEGWLQKDLRSKVGAARRKAKHESILIGASGIKAPLGPFPLILADPPWKWGHFGELDKENEAGKGRTPDEHYPTLTYDEIKDFHVGEQHITEIAHKDAALFMWCTSANLLQAVEVMQAWGFEYKAHAVWDKQRTGTGLVFMNQHEPLLYGTRGNMPGPQRPLPSSVFSYPRGRHSAKPPEVRAIIEKMYPDFDASTRLELFARETVAGWTPYGFESSDPAR